jgi:hypothetical protein
VRREGGRGLIARALVVAALALGGCATVHASAPEKPRRLAVHIDTIDPGSLQRFVDARLKYVGYLREHGASDLRGTYLQIGEHTFYLVYYFQGWGDLTRHGEEQARRLKNVDEKVEQEYHRDCDESLVFPHLNELWSERKELELGAPSPTALIDAEVGELVIESVKPTMEDQYSDTWPIIKAALEQAKYPLARVTYWANYGSGRMMSFWLAPSQAVLKAAPPLAQALAVAVGEERAAELLQKWRECVVATETHPVTVRHDMASPP